MTAIEIIGVHPIEAPEPCHLVEVVVRNCKGPFDLGQVTQEAPGRPPEDWQVPWDEKILDASGERVVADGGEAWDSRELWIGDIRVAFFFHYLDAGKPLLCPLGPLQVPTPRPLPDRLRVIQYRAPD